MATSTQVLLDVYLRSVYEPDVDYVDGELEERNLGEFDHSILQQEIAFWFSSRAKAWNVRAVTEQRTRVAVFSRSTPLEQVFSRPQLIAIEVLSPEDRRARMDKKIQNYIEFGVTNIWVVDPKEREGWNCNDGNWMRADRLEVPGMPIYLPLEELFRKIDEDTAG
jgi:Uma2 family endonuclease